MIIKQVLMENIIVNDLFTTWLYNKLPETYSLEMLFVIVWFELIISVNI